MKVKILKSISSPHYSYAAGQIIETSKERAAQFVKHGIAEKVETATTKSVKETAAKKTATKKMKKDDGDADDS